MASRWVGECACGGVRLWVGRWGPVYMCGLSVRVCACSAVYMYVWLAGPAPSGFVYGRHAGTLYARYAGVAGACSWRKLAVK
jgi:hypothetical protein